MAGVAAADRGRKKSLRLLAWSLEYYKGKNRWSPNECFNCAECFDDDDRRRQRRCALPGFNERTWSPWSPAHYENVHMGRLRVVGPDIQPFRKEWGPGSDPSSPPESGEDGCPGAWYRCAFADSVAQYERTITPDGAIPNLLLDRVTDPFLIEAVVCLENERRRHRNHWDAKISERSK